jgi:hypothetical protein
MAVPSTAKKTFLTASTGYGKAYYNLIVDKGRDMHEFLMMCQGADLAAEGARASATSRALTASEERGEMRKVVASLLLDKFSKSHYIQLVGITLIPFLFLHR